ncbi:hypothetical protein J0A68_15590 [Algoriphagus sp. H41]|uniref:TRAP-type C4-dicarboxylate transport system, substrate-binding protein n=1 Tax=Algoriphagus oliviformis TaxID=2811231 RepID=A0ABS3C5I0_9BACT|nr:hypothetical protein [Algoriphagus oliviformis]MBN7812375.1 hypothetical protein [Algoriphagus oliviformis]
MRSLFAFLVCFFFSLSGATAQRVILHLVPGAQPALPTEYRYREVLDHRIDKGPIGEVYERAGQKLPVVIAGDLQESARDFFRGNTQLGDSATKEIQVRVFDLVLKENYNPETKLYEGELELALGFFVIGSFDPVHLLDYAGAIQYQRSGFRMNRVEEVLNRLFYNSMVYFDTWIKGQSLSNRALAKSFRLHIVEPELVSTADKVYYQPDRPLVWEDFRARPNPGSRNNATIFTSFSLQGVSLMDSGSVVQTMEISVYMLPHQSWVKTPSAYGLNHEQRHFDLVRIVADRLIHRLENMDLSLDFYQAQINEAYLDAYREMNRLQELYEKGVNHGLDQEGQARWNEWIDEALAGDWRRIEGLLAALRR